MKNLEKRINREELKKITMLPIISNKMREEKHKKM